MIALFAQNVRAMICESKCHHFQQDCPAHQGVQVADVLDVQGKTVAHAVEFLQTV